MFRSQRVPTDQFRGSINYRGRQVSTITGSWLNNLSYDDQEFWNLETTDAIYPNPLEKCLPSDCRFREDSVAFGEGDLDKSQREKERLEEL